jgi:uracil-DNA glycosylase
VVERDTCGPWINRELALIAPTLRVVVALGAYGWDGSLRALAGAGYAVPRPKARFGHAASVTVVREGHEVTLLGCYHPSQHNTFTGRLTPAMLDEVFARARDLAGITP